MQSAEPASKHKALEVSPPDGPFLRSADAVSSKSCKFISYDSCRSFEGLLLVKATQDEGDQEGAGAQEMESLSKKAQAISLEKVVKNYNILKHMYDEITPFE